MDVTWLIDHWKELTSGTLIGGLTLGTLFKGKLADLWGKVAKRLPVKAADTRFSTAHRIVDLMGELEGDTTAIELLNDLLRHITEVKPQ